MNVPTDLIAPDYFHQAPQTVKTEQPAASTSAGSLPCMSRAEQLHDKRVISQGIQDVSENTSHQTSGLSEEQWSQQLATFTVGSHNNSSTYYVSVYPAGSTPVGNVGSKVHVPSEQVLSPGTPLRSDIDNLKARLPSIMEECSSGAYHPSGAANGPVHYPTYHTESKTPGAPSVKSRATHRSTQTLTGSEKYLQPMNLQDLKLPKSLPYYMQIYTQALSSKLAHSRQTICLWGPYPNQNLPQSLQEKHCTLGDVGIFDPDGNFEVFFNIFMTEEENAQMHYRTPENFYPLAVGDYEYAKPVLEDETQFYTDDFRAYKTKKKDTGHFSFVFESVKRPTDPGGAILALPEGYTKGTLLKSVIRDINLYLQDHVESWYSTANHWNSDNSLPNGALKLISTCYKSPIWGAGVLSRDEYQQNIPPVKMERLSFNERYRWNTTDGASIRINNGSTKRNAKDIRYTIAIEVLSVYRAFPHPRKSLFDSFTSNKTTGSITTTSKVSLRSRLTKSFTNSWSRFSISLHDTS